MADFGKLKNRRSTLGAPPSEDEASANLAAPEVAPAPTARAPAPVSHSTDAPARVDGRTLRRTGRTLAFATRVTPKFDADLREAAQRDGLSLVEILELALAMYNADAKKKAKK